MKYNCTGVILAGGKNIRLPGKKKALHKIGNLMIIEIISNLLSSLFKETIVVVNEPRDFAGLNIMTVTDIIPSKCSLAGLHAGLFYSSNKYAYVTGCDTPFLKESVIRYIISHIRPEYEVIIPKIHDNIEPLSAVYSKDCIPSIEKNLENNIFMIKNFFRKKKVKEIPFEGLKKLDPEMHSFFNINTPENLEKARRMEKEKILKPDE